MDSEGESWSSCLNMQGYLLGLPHFLSSHQSALFYLFSYKRNEVQRGWLNNNFKVTLLAYRNRCLNPNLHSAKVYFLSTIPYLFSDKSLSTSSYACQGSTWKASVILSPKAICKMIQLYKTADLVGVASSCLYCNLLFSLPLGYFYSCFNRWRNEYSS